MVRIEIWKDIEGFDGKYQVSNQGRVKSIQKGKWRLLKQGHGDGRYRQVVLTKNGIRSTRRVHRLVAEAFIQNPDNKPQIDHKDGNCLNNYADNLRWVSPRENTNNPKTRGNMRGSKKEHRKRREEKKMIQRLERMRGSDRTIVGKGYEVFYDRIRDCYMLSIEPGRTIDLNGKTYIVEWVDDLPVQFYTRDYLNDDWTIDYAGLWEDMSRVISGDLWSDDDNNVAVNEDGDDEIVCAVRNEKCRR